VEPLPFKALRGVYGGAAQEMIKQAFLTFAGQSMARSA
jgi:hypothetical protein